VSCGCRNSFDDGIGTLSTTAVLIKTSASWFRPGKLELLLVLKPDQPRTGLEGYFVSLFADDGSAEHYPGRLLSTPYDISAFAPSSLPYGTSLWVTLDISGAAWPPLAPATYYWVALTLGRTVNLQAPGANTQYEGVIWAGIDDRTGYLPQSVVADPALFTGRELTTQRFFQDAAFGATAPAAVNLVLQSSFWASVANASTRLTSWQGAHVRYGIRVSGWLATPSLTPSLSGECACRRHGMR
jgi:hypothetical protein